MQAPAAPLRATPAQRQALDVNSDACAPRTCPCVLGFPVLCLSVCPSPSRELPCYLMLLSYVISLAENRRGDEPTRYPMLSHVISCQPRATLLDCLLYTSTLLLLIY